MVNAFRYGLSVLARLAGIEPTCIQLTFQLVRSQRVYRRLVPPVGNDPTYSDFQSGANPSQLRWRIGVTGGDRTHE